MKKFLLLLSLLPTAVISRDVEKTEKVRTKTWYLAMNLNPSDGHIMDYTTGWAKEEFIGTYSEALSKDYLNREVWRSRADFIALVRHQAGEVDAVKVFRFKKRHRSLLLRFQDMDPGREVVTEGGPIQESISKAAQNLADDPLFSVGGDLAFNWGYGNNGARIVLTGARLSGVNEDDDNTHGLGNHFACNPKTGTPLEGYETKWSHEISNIQNVQGQEQDGQGRLTVQGTDHGTGWRYISGPVYGNYAIYVSEDATSFPEPGHKLDIEIEVEPKYRFFEYRDCIPCP